MHTDTLKMLTQFDQTMQNCWATRKGFFFFNWKIIILQYCDGFCHTSAWISHRHTTVPSFLNLPPHPTPLGCHRALGSLHHTANSHWLSILHMIVYMFRCYSLKSSHSLPPLLWPKVCSLCLHLFCCPASRMISTIFLDSIYMCYYVMFLFLEGLS